MGYKKGICCECGNTGYLNSRGVCTECVYIKNHGGKTRFEVHLEKQKEKSKLNKKKSSIKPKINKSTGERELFLEIWNERPHYCENPKCRKWLGNELKVFFFSHRKPKSKYPELRLVKSNIDLLCRDCHYREDFGEKINWEEKF